MRGFVLAAGFGTRLRPLTEHVPKALVPVCGEPLLKRSIDLLNKNGITEIAANAHYLASQIYDFRDASGYEFEIFHEEGKIRGTGGAFPFARIFLEKDEAFCVVNADIVSNANIKKLAEKFLASDAVCMLVASPTAGKGSILRDITNFNYAGIVGQDIIGDSIEPVDFIGISFYRKEFLDNISEKDFSIVPVWKRLQEKGYKVIVEVDKDLYWQDTGTPFQFAKVHFDMLKGIIDLEMPPHFQVHKAIPAAIADTQDNFTIQKLKGFCWIGDCNLDKIKQISNSIIFDNAKFNGEYVIENLIVTPWGAIRIND